MIGLVLGWGGCAPGGGSGGNDNAAEAPEEITEDTTLDSLNIPTGRTTTVRNGAVVTVTGDATIAGTLASDGGPLHLRVEGALEVTGTLEAPADDDADAPADAPLSEHDTGIFIVVGDGAATIGENAVLSTPGCVVVTDDPSSVLDRTPEELSEEMLDVGSDDLPTLIPFPSETAPASVQAFRKGRPLVQQGAELPPVTVSGTWPPDGVVPRGDQPIVIFRFTGARDLVIDGWTYNGPPAPPREGEDNSSDAGTRATGRAGRSGGNLHLRNEGGEIRIAGTVTLALSDGGRGGDATTVCATATGGAGAEPGNLRMTASGGINLAGGSLVIRPGRGGDGGEATVNSDEVLTEGCPGADGVNTTATGGAGGRNVKALFVRGNVVGLENVSIDLVVGGNGGGATASGCAGEDGEECCDAGAGGSATATGGAGGAASVAVAGAATASGARGGNGGAASASGGEGGFGGDCKFADAGAAGAGGAATATGGAGGSGAGAGASQGGDGGDAFALGGDGGFGGDSALGLPGAGSDAGIPTATGGAPGGGAAPGAAGEAATEEGFPGDEGDEIELILFCFGFAFVADTDGVIATGTQTGPIFNEEGSEELGTMSMTFTDIAGAQYFKGADPVHIGLQGGSVAFDAGSLSLDEGAAGQVGGLRIATLYGEGLSEDRPLVVEALNADGDVVGTQVFAEVPDNQGDPANPETFDATFTTSETIVVIRITVPEGAFVTIIEVCIIDP
ncbi:MAG: hypothetical protein KJ057_06305 [Phycisphaerae bacterium]|nr:hypothetical protein [Planctomycetia bacterium]MCK6464378.1 hypothetical protein [Phycisphaerae bacterium]MCL4718071.1 hypothetical protein [Phycisphaerae bacterium]MCQ3920205.1 hypothetical protein [Planctomycetota bacterium]